MNVDKGFSDAIPGLRFLTNEIYSTIFSFICSSNNNITRISRMVDFIYSKGEELNIILPSDIEEEIYLKLKNNKIYKFPKLSALIGIENELILQKFGYRASYICSAAKYLKEQNPNFDGLSFERSRELLLQIKGIGRKVADCILLIGLKFFHVVPLDTHIIRYSKSEFNLNFKSLNDKIYSEIQQLWIDKYGKYAGIIQLYVFKRSVDLKTGRKNIKRPKLLE